MKILVMGKKCGLIISIIKRLRKEGHEVHANYGDNKSLKSIDINDVNYNSEFTSRTAVKAFYEFSPDMVIYTGYYEGSFKPDHHGAKHLFELVNILNLSIDSSVSRFIYLSSYEVYESIGDAIECIETMDLKAESLRNHWLLEAEELVQRWSDYSRKIGVILRAAPVYGEMSETSWNSFDQLSTLADIKENEDVRVPFRIGNPVHVNDFVDAMIKSFDLVAGGIYNVAGDEQLTYEAFGNIMKHIIAKDSLSTFTYGEDLELILSTKRIKNELEWSPKYSCQEGLLLSINHNQGQIKEAVIKKKNERHGEDDSKFDLPRILGRIFLMLEVPILFLLVAIFYLLYSDSYVLQSVNIFILYIAVVSVTHRISISLLSAVFSSVFLIGFKFYNGYDLVNSFFDVNNILIIIQYFLIWAIISYTVDRYRELVRVKSETIIQMEKDKLDIEQISDMNVNIKNQLLEHISGYKDSFGKLYSVIDQLDAVEPAEIYEKIPNVLKRIMNCSDVSIYRVSQNKYMRLHSATCQEGKSFGRTVAINDYPELENMLEEQVVYTNLNFKPGMPMMAAPVISGGEPIAIIFLWNMPLKEMTNYFKIKFRTLALLISKNLERANEYILITQSERFIEDTEILKTSFYIEILETVTSLAEKDMAEFLLLKVVTKEELPQLSLRLTKLLRDTDYVGINNYGDVECILSNANMDFSESILQRFLDGGVECEVVL